MKTSELIDLLKAKGFSHDCYRRRDSWGPGYHYQHFLLKGDCQVKIERLALFGTASCLTWIAGRW